MTTNFWRVSSSLVVALLLTACAVVAARTTYDPITKIQGCELFAITAGQSHAQIDWQPAPPAPSSPSFNLEIGSENRVSGDQSKSTASVHCAEANGGVASVGFLQFISNAIGDAVGAIPYIGPFFKSLGL